MRTKKLIHIVSCHAEGEVGNVIVGGVPAPPGDSLWEQSRWIAEDNSLRQFVLNEPRGGVFKHISLLVPSKHPDAAFGFIVMEPEHTPPMSGSNSICVSTVLLDTGMIEMQEPETTFFLEAPAGLLPVTAYCEGGKAQSIEIQNVPSFADKLDAELELEGHGTLTVDIAYGGIVLSWLTLARLDSKLCPMRRSNWHRWAEKSPKLPMNSLAFSIPYIANGNRYRFANLPCLSSGMTAY